MIDVIAILQDFNSALQIDSEFSRPISEILMCVRVCSDFTEPAVQHCAKMIVCNRTPGIGRHDVAIFHRPWIEQKWFFAADERCADKECRQSVVLTEPATPE